MTRAIIIEDEANIRAGLKKMLKLLDSTIEVIAETGFVSEALTLVKAAKPDLVFLDIELEDGTGFDILKQLNRIDFKIIFTTAYNEYAIDAFKFSAVDYLLKPIDPVELKDAISRAVSTIDDEKQLENLLEIVNDKAKVKKPKIVLRTSEQQYIVPVEDIIHLEADGAYTTFITVNQKIVVSKNIKYYQGLLGDGFVRCHQSHLANITHIVSLHKRESLSMSNGELVPISTRKKSDIIKILSDS